MVRSDTRTTNMPTTKDKVKGNAAKVKAKTKAKKDAIKTKVKGQTT